MSAFVVSKQHIDALVRAGLAPSRIQGHNLSWYHEGERPELRFETADQVGSMLWQENVASVGFRYSPPGREAVYGEGFESTPDFELPGTYVEETIAPGIAPVAMAEWATPYSYPLGGPARRLDPVAILKAISCYEYQSCEHDGWNGSEAKAFCEALRDKMISLLPGYDEARWEINA